MKMKSNPLRNRISAQSTTTQELISRLRRATAVVPVPRLPTETAKGGDAMVAPSVCPPPVFSLSSFKELQGSSIASHQHTVTKASTREASSHPPLSALKPRSRILLLNSGVFDASQVSKNSARNNQEELHDSIPAFVDPREHVDRFSHSSALPPEQSHAKTSNHPVASVDFRKLKRRKMIMGSSDFAVD
eukprot:GDKJ01045182.1.p1 GENE.GDKJ01045182.1~~GDKJ01045182.1.p1  ORF type:complete len:189 (-),score=41.49 GDKJ01045182.1:197-763(-)